MVRPFYFLGWLVGRALYAYNSGFRDGAAHLYHPEENANPWRRK